MSLRRSLNSLPSLPTKFTKALPGDIYTTNVTEDNQTNLMRTPRPVHAAVYSHVYPETAPDPIVLAISKPACKEIELDSSQEEDFAAVFSGNKSLPGTRPWSLCYAGHQFGHYAGQLGDGRAISLFETVNSKGESWEIQLKGAGRTPYSRFGDGFAVLRSSIREFLMSEHMHALGVPTTRAIALINTTREVYREDGPRELQPENGAIVARMSPSWLRFGNFEIFYHRDDMDNVRKLADYTIEHVIKEELTGPGNKYTQLFRNITKNTAKMVAEWQAIGFNHGVMNTDNMSILGLTMDYGPFQMMDYYNPRYTCNHSDDSGRYAFYRQPSVCIFNLVRLSMPLFELIGAGEDADSIVFASKEDETRENVTDEKTMESYRANAQTIVQNILQDEFKDYFMTSLLNKMRSKIGLEKNDSTSDMNTVIIPLLDWMTTYQIDYHRFYRSLSNYKVTDQGEESDTIQATNEWLDIKTEEESQAEESKNALKPWLAIYRLRLIEEKSTCKDRKKRMDAVNPRFVLRNSIAEQVIQAFQKDHTDEEAKELLNICLDACINPFKNHYEDARVENWIKSSIPDVDMRCSCSS